MKIEDRLYVAIDYVLSLDSGQTVDHSPEGDPLGFIFGASAIIPGLERGLRGMQPGQEAHITVEPEEGYGLPNEGLVRDIPRENFPDDAQIEPGMGFEARGPHGPVTFRVRAVDSEKVVADFNHPLAGERLHFQVRVAEVREPRAEELAALSRDHGCAPSDCGSCGGSCGCG